MSAAAPASERPGIQRAGNQRPGSQRAGSQRTGIEGLERTVSGMVLRAVIGAAGASAVLVQGLGRVPVGALVLALAAVTLAALLPRSPGPAAALVSIVALVGFTGGGVGPRDILTVPLVHACHAAAGLAAAVPGHLRVELSALAPTLRRFGAVQALAVPVAVAAMLVRPGDASPVLLAAGGLALAAVAVVVAVLTRRVTARTRVTDGAS